MIVNVKSNELQKVQAILERKEEEDISKMRVIFIEEGNFELGLLGFINCLRKEAGENI